MESPERGEIVGTICTIRFWLKAIERELDNSAAPNDAELKVAAHRLGRAGLRLESSLDDFVRGRP